MASPLKSAELSQRNSPTSTCEYPEDSEICKSSTIEILSHTTRSPTQPPSERSTETDVTPLNDASNFDTLVPPPTVPEIFIDPSKMARSNPTDDLNNNNQHKKHSKKKSLHLTKKKHVHKTSNKPHSKKTVERENINVAGCLRELTELVKKLIIELEQSKQSREKFEAFIMGSLSTIESNWKQLQSVRTAAGNIDEDIRLEDISKPPLPGFIRKDGDVEKISQSILNYQFG
ncbi:PREDICTED: uncharacterized protein LOC105556890 [Vollenhovia emeryi]|uniref:uncharacterized protein LOC105556890 n=1 Tax=Vollenhovia emeryi TaxID=411798 RepID=UPI0005F4BBB3|nr:PREDICTED: uncharacterized protein LOC105556890 [Vollenhovia emeryi]